MRSVKPSTEPSTAIDSARETLEGEPANLRTAVVSIDPRSGAVRAYYGGEEGAGFDFAQAPVQTQDLTHLPLDGVQRIERRHRLLEDHRDAVAANALELLLRRREQILALEEDLARGMRGRGIRQQPQDRER